MGKTKELVMHGYLEKKSPKAVLGMRAWQERYFELVLISSKERGNEISLFYHKSQDDADAKKEPLGEIVLTDIKSVVLRREKGEGRFDVEVPTRVFSLKCLFADELQKWIATLEHMTQANKFKHPSAVPTTPAETMRLMAAASANATATGGPAQTFTQDATSTVELMSKGQAFIKYNYEHVTEKTTREIVSVFYKKDNTPLGSLYIAEPGSKREDSETALALHSLTDLFLGKQMKAFKSPTAANADAKCCFTALGTSAKGQPREFNLEGDSKEQVAAWLYGINAILTAKGGRKVMTAEESDRQEAAKRARVAEAKALELAAAQATQEQKQAAAAQAAAQAAQKAAEEEAARAQAAAKAQAEKAAAEQAAADRSAAEKAATEKATSEALAAAAAATAAAAAAVETANRAAAESAKIAAESAAAAAAATAALAAATASPRNAASPSSSSSAPSSSASAPENRRQSVVLHRKNPTALISPEAIAAADAKADAEDDDDDDTEDALEEAVASILLDAPAASSETAAGWLASLGDAYATEYTKLFRDNGVDLHFLVGLSTDELQLLGVKNPIHLKKMAAEVEKLRESGKYNAAPKVLATQQADVPADLLSPRTQQVVATTAEASAAAAATAPAAPAAAAAPAPAAEAPAAAAAAPSLASAVASAIASAAAAAHPAPAPITTVPQSPVGQWLFKLGPAFLAYLPAFEENGVDIPFLLTLNDDDLEELGVSKLHRKKMVQEIKELREQQKKEAKVVASATASASAAPAATASSSGKADVILAAAQARKASPSTASASTGDDIDLQGGSIAAIAARMAAQRQARAEQEKAEAAQQQQQQQ